MAKHTLHNAYRRAIALCLSFFILGGFLPNVPSAPKAGAVTYVEEINVATISSTKTISAGGNYRLYGTLTTSNAFSHINIDTTAAVTLYLDNVRMTNSGAGGSPLRMTLGANVTIVLLDGTTNTFTNTSTNGTLDRMNAGITVPGGLTADNGANAASLTITTPPAPPARGC